MDKRRDEKKQFLVILFIVFLGFIGISLPYLIFPVLFLNPDYSILSSDWSESGRAIVLGVTLAAYPFGQFIGSPILGSLSDDYGRKKLLSSSLFIAALCNLSAALAISWHYLGLLIISRFFAGFMEGNIAIARAMAADLTTISKHKTFGKINAMASIAYLVGPLLGGTMTDKDIFVEATAATPFYFTCILFLGIGILSMFVLHRDKANSSIQKRSFWQRINILKRLHSLFLNKRLQFLMIVSTCFTIAVDIFYEFGPVYLTIKWSLTPTRLIIYNAILCVALAVGNGWLPAWIRAHVSNRTAIFTCTGGFAILLIGMVLTNSPYMMMTLFFLSGLAIGLAVTIITVKISDTVPDQIQGEVMGVQVSLRVLGDALICLFGGFLLIFSSKFILLAAAGISSFATAYYALKK